MIVSKRLLTVGLKEFYLRVSEIVRLPSAVIFDFGKSAFV